MYCTVIKHESDLRTQEKFRKHKPQQPANTADFHRAPLAASKAAVACMQT